MSKSDISAASHADDFELACETQKAIAEACGCSQFVVSEQIQNFIDLVSQNQTYKAAASHVTDFEPPLSNIWGNRVKTM